MISGKVARAYGILVLPARGPFDLNANHLVVVRQPSSFLPPTSPLYELPALRLLPWPAVSAMIIAGWLARSVSPPP